MGGMGEKLMDFDGFDYSIDYRRGADWPEPYRVRILPTSNTRQQFRITAYGHTEYTAKIEAKRKLIVFASKKNGGREWQLIKSTS